MLGSTRTYNELKELKSIEFRSEERAQDKDGLAGLIRRTASTCASARAEVFQTELTEAVTPS